MERIVEEQLRIDDGLHTGSIVDVEERTTEKGGFKYIDLHIKFKQGEKEITLKASYPDYLSPTSKLGKLLGRFGIELNPGSTIEIEELKERRCLFQTTTTENKGGIFANVLPDTVKPAVKEETIE